MQSWTLILIADHWYTNMTSALSQPHAKLALLQATLELPPHETLTLRLPPTPVRYRPLRLYLRRTLHGLDNRDCLAQ